jgi:hypothetical protein
MNSMLVEDLLWLLLTSPAGGNFDQFFVHWLDETVIRVPSRLDRKPGARPWLGDFGIKTRLGLNLASRCFAGRRSRPATTYLQWKP